MLDFEVVPEYGLRSDLLELALGTPINQVLAAIQDCFRLIDKVEVAYSATVLFFSWFLLSLLLLLLLFFYCYCYCCYYYHHFFLFVFNFHFFLVTTFG